MSDSSQGGQNVESDYGTRLSVILLAGLVSLIFSMPFIISTYIPLVDLPHHIGRHQILVDIATGGPLAEFFNSNGPKIGNSTVDLIAASGWITDVVWLSRASLVFYAFSFIASIMVLYRVLWKRWSITPLIASPLIYNASFFWGFQNFILTIPMMIFLLALWITLEKRPVWVAVLLFFPLVSALYALHSFAFFALSTAVFGFEVSRIFGSTKPIARFGRSMILSFPFWLPLFHFLASQVLVDTGRPEVTIFGGIQSRLTAFLSPTIHLKVDLPEMAFFDPGVISNFLPLVLALGFSILIAFSFTRRIPVVIHPNAKGPILALIIAAALTPEVVSGVFFTHIRMPTIAFIVALSALKFPPLQAFSYRLVATLIICIGLARASDVSLRSVTMDSEMDELKMLLVDLDQKSYLHPMSPRFEREYLWHVTSYASVWYSEHTPQLYPSAHGVSTKNEVLEAIPHCHLPKQALSLFGESIRGHSHLLVSDPRLLSIFGDMQDLKSSTSENYMVIELCSNVM